MKKLARQVIFYAALLGVWALLAKLRIWPPYLFPPPWGVGHALWDGFADHSFWIGIAVTMKRMLIGYSLSVVLGMILGLAVSSSKFLEDTLGGLLVSLQSLPSICWIPLAVLWFGLTEKAILFVVLMGSLLSVTIAMEDGRKQMPKIYGMAGRNLGASGFRLFWSVLLPASLPFIVNGMKQGWAFADSSRNDFSQSRIRPVADDGSRSERYEPGPGRNDPDRYSRLFGGRPDLPYHGASPARKVWIDARVTGLRC
jgi:NitT/TauT family transport system permease protein